VRVYGRIVTEDADAWLFQPASRLERDPPLCDAVWVDKRHASRGPRLRWAGLDTLQLSLRRTDRRCRKPLFP